MTEYSVIRLLKVKLQIICVISHHAFPLVTDPLLFAFYGLRPPLLLFFSLVSESNPILKQVCGQQYIYRTLQGNSNGQSRPQTC
jgi:hypothetical protein